MYLSHLALHISPYLPREVEIVNKVMILYFVVDEAVAADAITVVLAV